MIRYISQTIETASSMPISTTPMERTVLRAVMRRLGLVNRSAFIVSLIHKAAADMDITEQELHEAELAISNDATMSSLSRRKPNKK